jgi:hypothetical protein
VPLLSVAGDLRPNGGLMRGAASRRDDACPVVHQVDDTQRANPC